MILSAEDPNAENGSENSSVSQEIKHELWALVFNLAVTPPIDRAILLEDTVETMERAGFPDWLITQVLDNFFFNSDDDLAS